MTTVVKVGGSLAQANCLPAVVAALAELSRSHRLVVVPGGGSFADAVRRACAQHDPGPSAAHWMAILAMDQHAHLLAAGSTRARLVVDRDEVKRALEEGLLPVLCPFRWLRAVDPLPHGWHVTSDSIAAWVAARLEADRLVLLKSVEGVRDKGGRIRAEVPVGSPGLDGVVDEYFAKALEPGIECWLVSGRAPRRLSELVRRGRTRGTRLRLERGRPARRARGRR